ncbi:alpha/beta hydrolase [Dyadobacter subterraneus]|uniref:Alpha/beta hydrolase n=1 Tax=Dyadobacter subterraneus TaxID=2773304 RepID=A0ABR9WDR0_9BACT|nr:alpha/beta hydrolase [Dyadobacter subterraneus]MBE9463269.1 alpha/beta hydrolase [Dyadobacter subterraneus]
MDSKPNVKTAVFINDKGQTIFYRNWINDTGKPKGIVIVVHGLNSHSGYYHNFAAQLVENDYEVYAIDLGGRGESEGERYYISDYNEVIDDIDRLVNIVTCEHPTLPLFLLGHSAGGVFASVYAALHQAKLKGLICESFAFDLPVPAFALAFIRFLSHIIPHARLVKLKNEDFSRDQSVVDKMNNDPLLANEKQPTRTMQQLLLAGEFLKNKMSEIRLPLLILHGTADKATNPVGSQYFLDHASSNDKQLKLYEGHYHDLLNDKYNGIIVKDILRWLQDRL